MGEASSAPSRLLAAALHSFTNLCDSAAQPRIAFQQSLAGARPP
jgi:hypothetical protein